LLEEIPRTFPKTRGIVLAALFAALLSVFSLITIPLTPVPVTLQVFMIFLIVNLLGTYYGALSCLIYLLLGAIGIPVFAGATGGISVLIGPLGGFLFSFPLSALIGGLISGKVSRSQKLDVVRVVVASAISLLLIYIIGPLWLGQVLGVSLDKAYVLGALPFIPFDIAKGIVAIPIALYFRKIRSDLPVNWDSRISQNRT
jgi:biotin transport system substrate-specific component